MSRRGTPWHGRIICHDARLEQWKKIDRIVAILDNSTNENELAKELSPYGPSLIPSIVCQVLNRTRNTKAATGFFGWAGQQRNYRHNGQSYAAIIDILSKAQDIKGVSHYVEDMKTSGIHADRSLYNKLITIYGRLGMLEEAERTFNYMRSVDQEPSLHAYTILLHCLVKAKYIKRAEEIFHDMLKIGVSPDQVLYSVLLDGYGRIGRLEDALKVLRGMTKAGYFLDKVAYTTMVYSYCNAGKIEEAEMLVKEALDQKVELDTALYNALLGGLCKAFRLDKAKELVSTMETTEFKPNIRTYNTLIDAFCKAGMIDEAAEVVAMMEKKGFAPTTTTFTILVDYYCRLLDLDKCFRILEKMHALNCVPDACLYNTLLSALCKAGRVEAANQLFERQVRASFSPVNTIIEKFCKGEPFGDAESVIDMIDKVSKTSMVTYGALINWLCKAGQLEEALELSLKVEEKGFNWNAVIYNTLITHLSKAQRIEEAKIFLSTMWDRGCSPTVRGFTAYIGGLCKAGKVAEVFDTLELMVSRHSIPEDVTFLVISRSLARIELLQEARAMLAEKQKVGAESMIEIYEKLSGVLACVSFGDEESNENAED